MLESTPDIHEWQITATIQRNQARIQQDVRRRACFIVANNVLDPADPSDEELVTTYKEQGSVINKSTKSRLKAAEYELHSSGTPSVYEY